MQKANRRAQHQHIVMIGRAAQKSPRPVDEITHLEAEPVNEEPFGRFEIGGSQHGMTKLARSTGPSRNTPALVAPSVPIVQVRCRRSPVPPAGRCGL